MSENEQLIAQEYMHLQKVVEDYDTKSLTVKAWSVTFSAAAIGFAYDKHQNVIMVAAAASAVAFWIVEALLKVNQQAYYPRIGKLEKYFAEKEPCSPMQIGTDWSRAFHEAGKYTRAFTIAGWPHVFMPHFAIAVLAVGLLVLHPPERHHPRYIATAVR